MAFDIAALTITTATVNVAVSATGWRKLELPIGTMRSGAAQVARVAVSVDAATTGTQTVRFVLVDLVQGRVLHYQDAACTLASTAVRSALAGSSGDYVCNVSFPETASSMIDLTGLSLTTEWRVGVTGFAQAGAPVTSVRVDVSIQGVV